MKVKQNHVQQQQKNELHSSNFLAGNKSFPKSKDFLSVKNTELQGPER